jgi:hypothetical protein
MVGAVALTLVLAPVGICQTDLAEEPESESSSTIEEIVVYGKKNIIHLRHAVYAAEENFFAVFNSLNSDDEYDVVCKYVFRLASHRRLRECKAKFLIKMESDYFVTMWSPNLATIRRKEKLLVEEMRTQVSQHPELLEVFTEMAEAKQDYDSELRRRRERR